MVVVAEEDLVNHDSIEPAHGFLLAPIDTEGQSVTVFALFGWLQKRPRPDMMTITALKTIVS